MSLNPYVACVLSNDCTDACQCDGAVDLIVSETTVTLSSELPLPCMIAECGTIVTVTLLSVAVAVAGDVITTFAISGFFLAALSYFFLLFSPCDCLQLFVNVVSSAKIVAPKSTPSTKCGAGGEMWSLPHAVGPMRMEKDKGTAEMLCVCRGQGSSWWGSVFSGRSSEC